MHTPSRSAPLVFALCLTACAATPAQETAQDRLLGQDFDQVLLELGPPLQATSLRGAWTLSYADASGQAIPDAILIVDDIVVKAAPGLVPTAPQRAIDRLIGARIEAALPILGPATGLSAAAAGASHVVSFGNHLVDVCDGRIAHIR